MKIIRSAIAAFFIFASCSKSAQAPQEPSIPQTYFSQQALAWADIPLNRYFIYKDSGSGQEDSVFCSTSNISEKLMPAIGSTPVSGANPAYYYQEYDLKLTTRGQSSDWFSGTDYSGAPVGDPPYNSSWIAFCGSDNYTPGVTCGFGFKFISDSSNYLRSINLNGKTYTDVVFTDCTDGASYDTAQSWYFSNRYYWAKGIGIIKRTVKTNAGTFSQVLERYGN
jgi:hypothetical protein